LSQLQIVAKFRTTLSTTYQQAVDETAATPQHVENEGIMSESWAHGGWNEREMRRYEQNSEH
jgi:hypothetical protein